MERTREILTPEQAADYLQINKETVYRYIRDGKLAASKLGRTYRIPRRSLELLLWTTRTRPDLTLNDYSTEQIAEFMRADQLGPATQQIADRFGKATERKGRKRLAPLAEITPSP